eukprot:g4618.t1
MQMLKMGKAMRRRPLRSALQRILLWKFMFMLMLFLCASSANADCSNVANEVAQILPGSTVQCEDGRCTISIEDARKARGGNWDKALERLSDCEKRTESRRLNTVLLTNDNIHDAVDAWLKNETSATQAYGDISVWDTSEVTDMSELFCVHVNCGNKKKSAAASFNANLSAWDVGKVSTMYQMFVHAGKFNSDVSKWDVAEVSDMQSMFVYAKKFNSDVSKWDVAKVSTMLGMFYNAHDFNSDVSKWNVGSVQDMSYMFHRSHKFNRDVSKWNVAKVNNFGSMFASAYRFNLKSLVVSVWDSNGNFPGQDMFKSTCSEDRENNGTCGTCADASSPSGNQPVECGAVRERVDDSRECAFCADYGDECCLPFVAADNSIHEAVSSWLDEEARARQTYGDISVWDTSEVTDMSGLFCTANECGNNKKSAAASFNGDLSAWDVGKVSSITQSKSSSFSGFLVVDILYTGSMLTHISLYFEVFYGAREFKSDVSKWNVAKVSTMSAMFREAASFNSDLSAWDVGRVSGISQNTRAFLYPRSVLLGTSVQQRPFFYATKFDSDVSKWNVARATNMGYMFYGAYNFYSDVSKWNVAKVSNMENSFLASGNFNGDVSKWDVAQVSTMNGMFHKASQFNSDVSKWDVAQVSTMDHMFLSAHRFNFKSDLESSVAWKGNPNFPGESMFNETCSEDRENGGSCGTCADASFVSGNQPADCGAMRQREVGGPDCTFCADYGDECCLPFIAADGSIHEAVSAWLEDETSARQTYGDISVWDTSEVTNMAGLFCANDECGNNKKSAAASFNGNLSAWNVGKVSTMYRMFYNAEKFDSDVSKWNVARVSTMKGMFRQAYQFDSDVSKWNVAKVSTMHRMFHTARTFNSDVSKWNVAKVSTMHDSFAAARVFNSDVSKWDVAKVSTMHQMFSHADEFNSDVSKWNVAKVTTMYAMFYHAETFDSDVSKWDVARVSSMYQSKYPSLPRCLVVAFARRVISILTRPFSLLAVFRQAEKFNSDVSKWDVARVSSMYQMFLHAYKFNSDVSKWRIEKVRNFNLTFSGASSFQHKADLDSVWEAINPTPYPGKDMFEGTCAVDEKCGKCGYADTNGRSIICGSSQGGRVPGDTPCENCWDYHSECCEPFEATDSTLYQAVDEFLDSPRDAMKIYGPIEDWNVAQVTSLKRLFDASRNVNAEHFNADISKWNTANVVDMSACFRGAFQFNADLSEWDVSRVRRMDLAFSGTIFNADVSFWETPALENISLAFADNFKFNRDLSQWDVRRVNDFEGAFEGASSFNFKSALDASWKEQNPAHYNEFNMYAGTCSEDASCGRCGQKMSKVEGSSVVCPRSLFKGDNALCTKCEDFGRECCKPFAFEDNNIHDALRAWLDDSSAATDVYGPIEDWDVSDVTNMYALFCSFKDCGAKKKALAAGFDGDLSKWNVAKVSTMHAMFYHAEKFDSDVSKWDVAIVTDMYYMFHTAKKFDSDVSKWDVAKVSTMKRMFYRAEKFDSDVSKWDVAKVSNMYAMFHRVYKFNSDVSKWDVSKVSTMAYMFHRAYQFNGDVSKWDVSKVSNMAYMFISAHKFNSDVSKWDVSEVSNMYNMFRGAQNFKSDVRKWDVSKVSNMYAMFLSAHNFNSDVSKWDVSKVSTMHARKYSFLASPTVLLPSHPDTSAFSLLAVFTSAYQFNSDVSKWDVSKVSTMHYMFENAYKFNSN